MNCDHSCSTCEMPPALDRALDDFAEALVLVPFPLMSVALNFRLAQAEQRACGLEGLPMASAFGALADAAEALAVIRGELG